MRVEGSFCLGSLRGHTTGSVAQIEGRADLGPETGELLAFETHAGTTAPGFGSVMALFANRLHPRLLFRFPGQADDRPSEPQVITLV